VNSRVGHNVISFVQSFLDVVLVVKNHLNPKGGRIKGWDICFACGL